jgi:3-isopropylmalate/(R)-2-methylmalate dehydratase small subunit
VGARVRPFTSVTGAAIPLDRVDVDTDQIIPKQFLKRVERSGYGEFLFFDWRFLPDGSPDPSFVLNRAEYKGAPILIAGRNFGCGSSREHAAWALADFGIRAVLAPSFADIFLNNCFQNGLVPVVLEEPRLKELLAKAKAQPGYQVTVDLERRVVSDDQGWSASFDLDPFRRDCLLRGLDEIDLTLTHLDEIRAFEEARTPA